MSIEHPFPPEQAANQYQVEEANSAAEVAHYFEIADEILGVDWGEEGPPEYYTAEHIAAHPEAVQVFCIKDANNKVIGGIKTQLLNNNDKDRLGFIDRDKITQKGVLLEYAAIREAMQNKGLIKILMQKGIEWAHQHRAEYICAEVEINNPRSAYIQMREGFEITDIRPPGEGVPNPYFVLIQKKVAQSANQGIPHWKEYEVTEHSFEELSQLFSEGWIGVDIKGAADVEYFDTPWMLILEKQS